MNTDLHIRTSIVVNNQQSTNGVGPTDRWIKTYTQFLFNSLIYYYYYYYYSILKSPFKRGKDFQFLNYNSKKCSRSILDIILTTTRAGRRGNWDLIPSGGNDISGLQSMGTFRRGKLVEEDSYSLISILYRIPHCVELKSHSLICLNVLKLKQVPGQPYLCLIP